MSGYSERAPTAAIAAVQGYMWEAAQAEARADIAANVAARSPRDADLAAAADEAINEAAAVRQRANQVSAEHAARQGQRDVPPTQKCGKPRRRRHAKRLRASWPR